MRILLVALLSTVLFSCHFLGMGEQVTGSGRIITEERTATNFNSIDVSGAITVQVKQSNAAGVKLETDENLMQYIEVFTSGNTLTIRSKKGYDLDPSKDIIAYVTAPSFKDLDVSGSCDIISDGSITGNEPLSVSVSGSGAVDMEVNVPKITTSISGSGSIDLKGQAKEFDASVSGSGDVKCFDLVTESAQLSISGAGNGEVNVSKQLDVRVSGSGNVKYKGSPNITKSISGAGSVSPQ